MINGLITFDHNPSLIGCPVVLIFPFSTVLNFFPLIFSSFTIVIYKVFVLFWFTIVPRHPPSHYVFLLLHITVSIITYVDWFCRNCNENQTDSKTGHPKTDVPRLKLESRKFKL